MKVYVIACFLAVLACASASTARNHVWQDTGVSPRDGYEHKFIVALKQSNTELLEKLVLEVSDPTHAKYGQYFSNDEVTELVAPPENVVRSVQSWLYSAGASRVAVMANRDVMVVHMPVRSLETTFNVKMTVFQHPLGHHIIRTSSDLALPREVADHVDIVHNVNDFPLPRRRLARDVVAEVGTPADTTGAAPGSVVISASMSRGSNTIATTFTPVCLDGSSSSSVNPCSDHGVAIKQFVYTMTPLYNFQGTVSVTVSPNCQVMSGTTVCTVKAEGDYYKLYNTSVLPVFDTSAGGGVESYWTLPVVSTPPVTPQTLANLYGIPHNIETTNGSQAVGEFEQQYYSPSDLDLFFKSMGIRGADTPVTVVGFNNATKPGGEANLDIQYIMGVARGVPTTLWSIYASSTVEIDDILKWCYQMGNVTHPPLVNSLSYGMTAFHVDQYLGKGYLLRSDYEFMKMALRGITIIIADGDTGAGDLGPIPMSSPTCKTLHPDWPSQSPYVTAIASTYITPNAQPICYMPASEGGIDCMEQPLREVTVNMDYGLFWTSGGGFANNAKRAPWQAAMVEEYLNNTVQPPANMFNSAGRAYPDAVAVGHNLIVALGGQLIPIDGTSASAPIFAGVMSLINSELLNNDLPALGFLNPFMYYAATHTPSSFNDILVGNNRCGSQGFSPLCCEHGYEAAIGWDAASGLGSPNYPVLLSQAMKYMTEAVATRK